MASGAKIQEPHALPGVNDGENDFLYGKSNQLDALENVESGIKNSRFGCVAAQFENRAWDMEDYGVDDDHGESGAQDAGVVTDEMESRPEYQ